MSGSVHRLAASVSTAAGVSGPEWAAGALGALERIPGYLRSSGGAPPRGPALGPALGPVACRGVSGEGRGLSVAEPLLCGCVSGVGGALSLGEAVPGPRVLGTGRDLSLAEQIPVGRLVELSGNRDSARFTMAVAMVVQAQAEGETVAWVQQKGGSLFPPDLHESGVDLESLIVVHVAPQTGAPGESGESGEPRKAGKRGSYAIPKAAELLLRSGGFGLLVLDLTGQKLPTHTAWQGRLQGLAREHKSRVVCLTDTPRHGASLGPLIGLRIQTHRVRVGKGVFAIKHRVLKNKAGVRLDPGAERRRAPWGLE